MKYYLSTRCLKEVHNGKLVQIALPVDDDGIDPMDFARLTLVLPESRWLRRARLTYIRCIDAGTALGDVAEQIGAIFRAGANPSAGTIVYRVLVVLVEVCDRDHPRGTYPPNWPGRAQR